MLPKTLLVLNEHFYEDNGQLYCPFNWWRYAGRIAKHCDEMGIYAPLCQQAPPSDAKPISGDVKVHGRFFYTRMEEYYAKIPLKRRQLIKSARELFAEYDLILFRVPAPDCYLLAPIAWELNKPTVLLIGGDLLTGTAYENASGLKAFVARLMARRLRSLELKVAAGSAMVATWGDSLYKTFSKVNDKVAKAAAPNISSEDIYHREDVATGDVIRLVRVARVLPNKGLEYLIQAVAELRSVGRNVVVDIAGSADDEGYEQSLRDLASGLNVGEHITFHGSLDFGPPLFDLYRSGDIHVMSSLSEGIPRCIAEARVFGLPTVATRVGGVPDIIHDGIDGLLIDAESSSQIAQAIERLLTDEQLRRSIIKEGYRLAGSETAEFQARRLTGLIRAALDDAPLGPAAGDLHIETTSDR